MKVSRTSFWGAVGLAILAAGAYAAFLRFARGLQASTHLTDAFPWGIWVGFDVLVGVGLTAGGFVIAATVHIFNIKKYEPIVRPAILTAFLGYLLEVLALMFDLGRPLRLWHPLIMWNPQSPLFVVAWCVMLYSAVLALEFSPAVFERFNLKVPLRAVRFLYVPIVIAGVLIATIHQASLGALYVIVPDKLHPLWYSPSLPLLFLISAVGGGLAMTIVESFLSHQAFGKRLEKDVLVGLGRVILVVLAVYLVFRVQDLTRRGGLPLVFRPSRESIWLWVEMGVGAFLPLAMLLIPPVRGSEKGLFFVALLVVSGFVINRLNVSITGMLHSETYFPKWTEMAITLSMAAVGFIIFSLAVRYLSVFPAEELADPVRDRSVFSGPIIAGTWGLLAIGAILWVYGKDYIEKPVSPGTAQAELSRPAIPRTALSNLPAPMAYPKQRKSPGVVTFRHETHVDPNKGPECAVCHDRLFEILRDGTLDLEAVDKDAMEKGENCAVCHDGRQAFGLKRHCRECHEKPATTRRKKIPVH